MTRWFRNVWETVRSMPTSMAVSWKTFREPPITLEYPDEKWTLPERARAQLYMDVDDCIGCNKCAHACPVDCIHIETVKAGPDEDLGMTTKNTPKKLHVLVFDIDMAKCCYCNLCTFPCPTECLYMTPNYEASTRDRYDMVYHFGAYTPEAAREIVAKARERDGAKFLLNVLPKHLESVYKEKRGTSATGASTKSYPEPKPAAAPAAPPPTDPAA